MTGAMASVIGTVALPRPAPGVLWRTVVPGWPQIHCGQVTRGRVFLLSYLAALGLGILFAGTLLGALMFGLALALHASSVLDVVMEGTRNLSTRIIFSLSCMLVLAVGVYWPVRWLVSQVVVPQRIVVSAPPLEAGDVLWYSPSAYGRSPPEAGDVVLYLIPPVSLSGRTPQGNNAVYRIEGLRIDRVVAGPGQQVEWTAEGLDVDGRPSLWRPLNPNRVPAGTKITVPAGQVCIVPSTTEVPGWVRGAAQRNIAQLSLVPVRSVRGKVYFRSQPFWRIGWLR
jgi:hypothetical protein